jgi:hypothetical protein
LKYCAID